MPKQLALVFRVAHNQGGWDSDTNWFQAACDMPVHLHWLVMSYSIEFVFQQRNTLGNVEKSAQELHCFVAPHRHCQVQA